MQEKYIKINERLSRETNYIGRGGFGEVYRGIYTDSKGNRLECAIKIPCNPEFIATAEKEFKREYDLLTNLDHPNIIKAYEIGKLQKGGKILPFIAMEYLSYDLKAYMRQNGKKCFSEEEAKVMMYDICKAVHYLHEVKGIIHRDLKMENILMDQNYNLKIIDFGMSKKIDKNLAFTYLGTLNALPPEVLITQRGQQVQYSYEFDIWGLGCIFYHLLTGKNLVTFKKNQPFVEEVINEAKSILEKGASLSNSIKGNARDLMAQMFNRIGKDRIKIDQILEHQWFGSLRHLSNALNSVAGGSVAGETGGTSSYSLRMGDNNNVGGDSGSVSASVRRFRQSLNAMLANKISAAMQSYISDLLRLIPKFDSGLPDVIEFDTLVSLKILKLIVGLRKSVIRTNKDDEVEINLLGFLSDDLKKKVSSFQASVQPPSKSYIKKSLAELDQAIIDSVKKFQQNETVDQKFKSKLLEVVPQLNSAAAAHFILSIVPSSDCENEYFMLADKFDLSPVEKKILMFRIIDQINRGAFLEKLEPTQETPIINIESMITVEANFRSTN